MGKVTIAFVLVIALLLIGGGIFLALWNPPAPWIANLREAPAFEVLGRTLKSAQCDLLRRCASRVATVPPPQVPSSLRELAFSQHASWVPFSPDT